jgi:hypothetical protein
LGQPGSPEAIPARAATFSSCANQRLRLLTIYYPEKVLSVLIAILCLDCITSQERGLREGQITLVLPFGSGHPVVVISTSLSGRSGRTET